MKTQFDVVTVPTTTVRNASCFTRLSTVEVVQLKLQALGFNPTKNEVVEVCNKCKSLASNGYVLDPESDGSLDADASLALLYLDDTENGVDELALERGHVTTYFGPDASASCEANIRIFCLGQRKNIEHTAAMGDDEFVAIERALRKAISPVIGPGDGIMVDHDLIVRQKVIMRSGSKHYRIYTPFKNGAAPWVTLGVGDNFTTAFIQALIDGFRYAAYLKRPAGKI